MDDIVFFNFLSSLTDGDNDDGAREDDDECSDDDTLDAGGAGNRASNSARSIASGVSGNATGALKVMCTVPHRPVFNVVLPLLG